MDTTDEATPGARGGSKVRKREGPRKASPRGLENAALFYLQRYASSAENLRRVLMRRVERSARAHGTDREEGGAWVDEIVARFTRAGLVDDRAYAEGKAGSLYRRGASLRRIRGELAAKGVAKDLADDAIAALEAAEGDPDTAAAIRLARRRRLGPFRAAEDREERRERDLAALARAGFGYDTARRVIDAEDEDALEQD
jgi:regulatory protein